MSVLAAGFLLNRVVAISRIREEISARQALEGRLTGAVRDSVRGQFGAGRDEKRFFLLEARAEVQAEALRRIVIGDDRETMVRFINLHGRLGEEFRRSGGYGATGAEGQMLNILLDEVAQHLDARREAEKAALRASFEKAGLCLVVAILLVLAVYLVVTGVLARVRREMPSLGDVVAG